METFEALLSSQVIAGVLFVAALAMGVRSFLFFTNETSDIGPKLKKIDHDLKRLQNGMADQKAEVESLNTEVGPMAEKEEAMRVYLEELKQSQMDAEKRAYAAEQKDESAKKRRIQRKKMGLDS